jgi:hypothetical protein
METLILLEDGDEVILHTNDKQERKAMFRHYDYENAGLIVEVANELRAFGFDEIDNVELLKPIKVGLMLNTRLALSQQTIDRWRASNGTKSGGADVNPLVGNGVLTANTRTPIGTAK